MLQITEEFQFEDWSGTKSSSYNNTICTKTKQFMKYLL